MTNPELLVTLVALVVSCVLVRCALHEKGDVKALIQSWFGSIELEVKEPRIKKPRIKKRRSLTSRNVLPKEPTAGKVERCE